MTSLVGKGLTEMAELSLKYKGSQQIQFLYSQPTHFPKGDEITTQLMEVNGNSARSGCLPFEGRPTTSFDHGNV